MEFSERELLELKKVFGAESLTEEGLRSLLLDFEMDESFAPAMLRILMDQNSKTESVEFDSLIKFFKVLTSGNIKEFFKLLFSAIDVNGDGTLGPDDLVQFATLVNDALTRQEALSIVQQCDMNSDGKVGFDDFWKWYKTEHGIDDTDDEDEEETCSEHP